MPAISPILIELAANVSRLQRDMGEAKRVVATTSRSIEDSARFARDAISAIGSALVVQKLFESSKRAVEYLGSIQDAAEVTGVSVANLTRLLGDVAPSGTSVSDLSDVMVKLARAMQDARNPTSVQAQVLKILGVSATDAAGNLRPVDEVMREVAKAQLGFADGTGKSSMMLALLGKSGAATIPMLNDLAEGTGQVDRQLEAAVAEADKFDKMLKRLGTNFDQANAQFWTPLIRGINAVAEAFKTANRDGLGFVDTLKTIPGPGASQQGNAQFLAAQLARARESLEKAQRGSVVFGVNQVAVDSAQQRVDLLERQLRASLGRIESVDGAMANNGAPADNRPNPADPERLAREAEERAKAAAKAAEDAAKRQQEVLDGQAKAALERLKRYDDAERLADEAIAERQAALAKAYGERHDAAMKTITSLADEVKRQREANEEIGLSVEQVAALKTARDELALATLEEAQAEAIRKGEASGELDLLGEQIALTRQLIEARRSGAARQAEVDAARAAADEWKRTSDMIEQGLVDSLYRAAESGKDVFQSLRDSLRGMFNNLVLRPIIQAAVGGVGASFAGAAGASTGGAGGMLSSLGGLSSLAGGAGLIGSYAATGVMSSLSGIGLGTSLGAASSLATGGSVLGGLGLGVGAVAPYALGAYAAYRIISSLTRRRVTAAGIEGTLGGDAGFSGNAFEEWKRTFGGSGRNTSALDPSMQSGIAQAVVSARTAVTGYAQALGLPVDALRSYTQALRIDTRDLSPEQVQQKIADAVKGFTDGLSQSLGEALTQFTRDGESATDTLVRLSSSLSDVNKTLGDLGQALLDIGTGSGDAASQLLDRFGGTQNFRSAAGTYLQSYYTDGERAALMTQQLRQTLGAAGLSLPQTRAEYRRLVEAQDLLTESGRAAYTALLQSAGAFDEVATYAQSAADAANREAQAAIDRAKDQARAVAEAWTSIGDSLLEEVRRIRGELASDPGGDFQSLLDAARNGDQVAAGRLPEAARSYLESARGRSSTGVEYAIAQARVAAGLEQVAMAAQASAASQLATADTLSPVMQSGAIDAVIPAAPVAVTPARDAEIAALREEVRAGLAAVASATAETARVLRRWDQDTLPPAYPTVTDPGTGA